MAESAARSMAGRIFDVQRFCIHDGPGIRTTVFLKGCPLTCDWCHNPESVSSATQLSFLPEKCIGCGYCFRACSREGHRMIDGRHALARERCVACGECARECYAKAIETVGRDATVGEVIDEVLRDRPFYETSGGGMTLSGGEPLAQVEFSEALLIEAKREGLHCVVETCGLAGFDRFERIRPHVDLFLFDVKETDPARHREFTGADNGPILENLRRLHDAGSAILLRLPLVPGFNDREDHFEAVGRLASELPRLEGVEVLPYHPLGEGKRERMGMPPARRTPGATPEKAEIQRWIRALRDAGAPVVNEAGDEGDESEADNDTRAASG